MSELRQVVRASWWLDVTGFPDLLWARLQVFSDGSADVLDLDGRVHDFADEQAARLWLNEDEYERADAIDGEDLKDACLTPADIVPPSAESQSSLVAKMLVRRRGVPPG